MTKRKDDKWVWGVGEELPPLEAHSRVKHLVIQDYLSRYIQVVMANQQIPKLKLTLVDGFAGGGLYAGSNGSVLPGSPLLLLQTVAEAEDRLNVERHTTRRSIDASYHFVEMNPSNYRHLAHTLAERGYSPLVGNKVHLYNDAFENVAASILQAAARRLGGERALFLLDQYNYSDVDFRLVRQVLSTLKGSEVILTFNVDSLISFLTDSDGARKIISNIGLGSYIDLPSIRMMKASGRYREIIQRQIAAGIQLASGARFMTLFFVTPQGASPWSYWLVHLSNVYKANDVMKEVHWHHGNAFGHSLEPGVFQLGYQASRDPDVTGQAALHFDTPAAFDEMLHKRSVARLRQHLCTSLFETQAGVRFSDLVTGIANRTNATADMIREALHVPLQDGEIFVAKQDGGYRRKGAAISSQDTLIAKQKTLFI